MYTLERLENALLARWGREEMTVYADYLQSIGDPRGEAIAIDLVNLDTVDEDAWRARRQALLATWLGEDLATRFEGQIFQGFVQEAGVDEELLASPAGDYVRAARFTSNDRAVYERFAERPRRWLTHLAISGEYGRGPMLDDLLVRKLVAATPRVDQLVLRGTGIALRLDHPNVRHVRVEGRAVGSLGWRGDFITPPGSTFAIERHLDGTRLYLGPTFETLPIVKDQIVQKHTAYLRFAGAHPVLLTRALAALPRVAVVEVTVEGDDLDRLRTVANKYERVRVVSIER